jgi:transposase
MAATSSFLPEVLRLLIAARREGKTNREAAEVSGVHFTTLQNWLRYGRSSKGSMTHYAVFANKYDDAYRLYVEELTARLARELE